MRPRQLDLVDLMFGPGHTTLISYGISDHLRRLDCLFLLGQTDRSKRAVELGRRCLPGHVWFVPSTERAARQRSCDGGAWCISRTTEVLSELDAGPS